MPKLYEDSMEVIIETSLTRSAGRGYPRLKYRARLKEQDVRGNWKPSVSDAVHSMVCMPAFWAVEAAHREIILKDAAPAA